LCTAWIREYAKGISEGDQRMWIDAMTGGYMLAAAIAALALAACRSSSKPAASSPYGPASSPFALSKCMRDNGVSNFPDPTSGPGGEGFSGGLAESDTGTLIVDGITISGPAAQAAEKACRMYLPPGSPPPQLSAAQRARLLALARCMRTHGVPNFPDPVVGSRGPAGKVASGPNGIDKTSPAFRLAVADCGGHGDRVAIAP
jgi:hypothetical protein